MDDKQANQMRAILVTKQLEIDNCKEAKMLLDSAIKSDYLFHTHNLTCQEWIKEYNQRIEYLYNFLEGAMNE